MFSLSSTYATNNPSLIILRAKGYVLSVVNEDRTCTYIAVAPGRRFAANSGAELLGLVTIWEHFGEDWNRQEPDIMDDIIE